MMAFVIEGLLSVACERCSSQTVSVARYYARMHEGPLITLKFHLSLFRFKTKPARQSTTIAPRKPNPGEKLLPETDTTP